MKRKDYLTWEEYYEELNKYAKELNYKNAIDMREELLDKTTDYFIKGMEENTINSFGGVEKATYSVKSVLKKFFIIANDFSDETIFASG